MIILFGILFVLWGLGAGFFATAVVLVGEPTATPLALLWIGGMIFFAGLAMFTFMGWKWERDNP